MNKFTLYLKNDLVLEVKGSNMIDACIRSGKGIDYKSVNKYQENGGDIILFSSK